MLTQRDQGILGALCLKVRLLSVGQVASGWFQDGKYSAQTARRRLDILVHGGFVQLAPVAAHPLIALERPVLTWAPGHAYPDAVFVSSQLQTRWAQELRPTQICVPTRRALRLMGGKARRFHAAQSTHDLHLSQVFLQYRATEPDKAERWIGEGILAASRKDEKLPDAFVPDSEGDGGTVIEFGGAYSASRVRSILDDCDARGHKLELW